MSALAAANDGFQCALATCRANTLRKLKSKAALRHWQHRRLALMCTAWRQQRQHAGRFHGTLQAVAMRMERGLLSQAVGAWLAQCHHKQSDRIALANALTHWRSMRLANAMLAWQEYHARCAAARRVVARLQHRHTAGAFGAWHAFVARRQGLRLAAAELLLGGRQRRLAGCWVEWRCWMEEQHARRESFSR